MRLPPPPSRLLPSPLATLSSAMLSLVLALPLGLRAAPLPAELAGTWSQPGSVFENGRHLDNTLTVQLQPDGTLRMDTAPQRPPAASAGTPARPAEANVLVRQEPQVPAALAAKLQQMALEETGR